MTSNSTIGAKKFFNKIFKTRKGRISTKTGGKGKAFLSKLSGAFLLPISILAIAGLFLGVGATIASNCPDGSAGQVFGNFIKQLGDPLFGALPLLFAAAIAISFTEEAGVAVFNSIVGYLLFSALQSVFIEPVEIISEEGTKELVGYKILFDGGWRNPDDLKALIGSTLGFNVMQTSVFGGIVVGFVVQWAYNRFHTIKLPTIISFFGGKRFVALAVVVLMIPVVFVFLLLWPYIGYIFNLIGKYSGMIPYGFDSFIFGYIERALVPFGLHHVFYSPLWYTSAGGDVSVELQNWLNDTNHKIQYGDLSSIMNALKGSVSSSTDIVNTTYVNLIDPSIKLVVGSVNGDSSTSLALLGVNTNVIHYEVNGIEQTKPLFIFVQDELGLKLGRFLDGKFSFMQWGLPFAGLAMIMAAPKENRKMTLGTIFPAAITSFVTGVTEPLEFTFLFLAPALFFGFHAIMCAISFLMANILSVHVGMAFSGGFLDLIVYGMIPVLKGTNFWWTIVVGMAYIPIYYFVFYFWIKKADLPTPGRGGNTKLFTKKDYQSSKSKDNNTSTDGIDQNILNIIEGFGGRNNIDKTANCATRLRFDLKDASKISEQLLKDSGAFGVNVVSNTHVQAIFGPKAEQLRIEIDDALKTIDKNPSSISNKTNSRITNNIVKPHQIATKLAKDIEMIKPTNGQILSLSSINDGVFSEKMLGNGFASELVDGNVYSPVDGKIIAIFPTKHAYGIETTDGVNILIHIGIDTVSLDGKGFESMVKEGQIVKKGQLIAKVDLNVLKENNLKTDVICIVTKDSKVQPGSIIIR